MGTDYIKRQAALNIICHDDCVECPDGGCDMYRRLKRLQTADVVEVVRCKDCKYYKEGKLLGPSKFCYYYHIGTGLNTADDDFCSHGKRRAGNG